MNRLTLVGAAGFLAAMLGAPALVIAHEVTTEQIQAAKTPADHEAIAKSYEEAAEHAAKTASTHRGMAAAYKSSNPKLNMASASLVRHCDNLAKQADASAGESRALAAEHRKMSSSAH